MDNLLRVIQSVGYPVNSNVRITPVCFFDEQTLSSIVGENRFFTNDTLSTYTRNKKFPLANDILFIDTIAVRSMGTAAISLSATNMGLFTKTAIQILVDGRERLKIPLLECFSCTIATVLGTTTTQTISKLVERSKKLRLPIIVNSQSNVEVKIITDADYSSLGSIRVELSGLLYTKLQPFSFNPSAGKPFERLSYTIFDTSAVVASVGQKNYFNSSDKAQNLYSKIFPLSASETFEIENIEVAVPLNIGTAATVFEAIEALARETVLKINVNGVEMLDFAGKDLVTVLFQNAVAGTFKHSDGTITTNFVNNQIHYGGFTLPVPITIPAKAQVKVTVDTNAVTNASTTPHYNVMLKGTLQRLVQ
ncbi:MAG: hypothetical protein AB1432_11625 [Bacteroidota bacterium]|jgi:hypothetical protein